MLKKILFFLCCFIVEQHFAQHSQTSPDGNVKLTFALNEIGKPYYKVSYKNKEVIKESFLGLELKNTTNFISDFSIKKLKKILLTKLGSLFGEKKARYEIIIMSF